MNLDSKAACEHVVEMPGVGAEPLTTEPSRRGQFEEYVVGGVARIATAYAAAEPLGQRPGPDVLVGVHCNLVIDPSDLGISVVLEDSENEAVLFFGMTRPLPRSSW
jgi:hypothetical protein